MGENQPIFPAGWYADPTRRAPLRYWTGDDWSAWTSDGTTMTEGDQGRRRPLGLSDMSHLDFVDQVFLGEARTRGLLTHGQDLVLEELLDELRAEATGATLPVGAQTASDVSAVSTVATLPTVPTVPTRRRPAVLETMPPGVEEPSPKVTIPELRGGPRAAPHTAAKPREPRPPSAVILWWVRTREAVGSDLAVHGLAYLGVLLFFVGAFGLVAFAFGDVAPALRPVAEAVIVLAPFAAGVLLRRRGATVVGRALEVAGGLLLPIMLITTFLDGVAFPPDLEGVALAVALTALTLLVALAYAVWSRRHPDSALRYLVAPVAWLSAAMATLGVAREMPVGRGVATPSAAQCAAMLTALVATTGWARLRPDARLAAPTTAVTLPGLAVISAMSLLTWTAEGWPGIPVLVSGALVLVALELVSDRLPAAVLGVIEPLWWALVAGGLAQAPTDLGVSGAAVAAVVAVGFVAILDTAGAARRPGLALTLPAIGAVLALSATWVDPWWAVASFGVATLWAALRRVTPFDHPVAAPALDVATAALPVGALAAVAVAADVSTAVLAGGALALLATVPARGKWTVLDRTPHDPYWSRWWAGGCLLVALVALSAWQSPPAPSAREEWFLAATLGLLTLATVFGPMDRRLRPLVVTALSSATWVVAAGALNLATVAVVTPLSVAGLTLVTAAHASVPQLRRIDLASLGLTGHALGVASLLIAVDTEWALVITTALATVGWCITGWIDSQGHSVVGSALSQVHPLLRWLPLGLAAVGLPASVLLVLDRSGVLPLEDPWSVVVLAATALAYAALTRVGLPSRVLATAAWGGFGSSVFACLLAGERLPAVVSVAVVPVAVTLIRPPRRHVVMIWTAWLALTPLTGLLALEYSSWFASLPWNTAAALCLVGVGSMLVVGGAAGDLRGRAWAPRLTPEHEWARAPILLGGAQLVAGVALAAVDLTSDLSGWAFAAAAAAVLVTAALARAGLLAGVAALLGWAAVMVLATSAIESRPWIAVVAALGILLAAELLSRLPVDARWWSRWDRPLLAAAAPVAVTALVAAGGGPAAALTFTAVGAEFIAVAARLRRRLAVAVALGAIGTALVLWGAGLAGTGWLALALLALSASLSGLAIMVSSTEIRLGLQIAGAGAALAAWRAGSDWLLLSDQRAVEIAAVGAGVLSVAAAVAAWRRFVDRSWVLIWGGMAIAVEAISALDTLAETGLLRTDVVASWPVVAGLGVAAMALAAGAAPVGLGWLRDLSVVFALASLMIGMRAAAISTTAQVAILSGVSVVSAGVTLAVSRRTATHPWRRALLVLGAASTLWAIVAASFAPSDAALLAPALAVAAIQAAAAGVALHRVLLQMAAPVLAVAAWLVFSLEALDGNPQWITVPIGVAVLVIVALWRRDRRERGGSVASTEIVVVELIGVGFLVGSALVQTFTDALAYAALSAAIGLGVMAWGAITKVRRRVAAGAAVVAVSVTLLIGVPLVHLLPSWEGAGLWILIGGVGLLAVLVASMIERGKAVVRKGLARLSEATVGWE